MKYLKKISLAIIAIVIIANIIGGVSPRVRAAEDEGNNPPEENNFERWFDNLRLEPIKDENNKNELIVLPAVMYNYKPSGGDDWWNQFADLNRAIAVNYCGNGRMTHPLILGAFSSKERGNYGSFGYEGALRSQTAAYNDRIPMDNRLWYYNHNASTTGGSGGYNGGLVNAPVQGIAAEYLSEDGRLLAAENNTIIPLFDDEFLTGRADKFGSTSEPISFPFRDRGDGYYVFDSGSGEDNVYMNDEGRLVYNSSRNARIKNLTDSTTGFFPFNTTGNATRYSKHLNGKATSNANLETNYGFGMRLDIPFNVARKGDNNEDIVFNFTGDDDLWIYIDGRLALDMGGAHGKASGSINFTKGTVTVNNAKTIGGRDSDTLIDGVTFSTEDWLHITDNRTHTLTAFYMERGLYDSNLKIEFNFNPVQLAASDSYYAELGTPIEMDIPTEFADLIERGYTGTPTALDGGQITYNTAAGKYAYVSSPEKKNAFAETINIVFNDAASSVLTYTVHNYCLNDDVYVIDYGLPVELHSNDSYDLFCNDELSINGDESIWELGLSEKPNGYSGKISDAPSSKYSGADASIYIEESLSISGGYGRATADKRLENTKEYGSYKYTPDKFLDSPETFYYAVQVVKPGTADDAMLNAGNATPVMTSSVTIVPASIIYYEDDFSCGEENEQERSITYTGHTVVVNNTNLPLQSNNQDELYGFDTAYANGFGDSLEGVQELGDSDTVQFDFVGTGFDILARAGNTAAIYYLVADENGNAVNAGRVDSFYNNGELTQLPIISVSDLEHKKYKVTLLIEATGGGSNIYFDGIRIYNPLDDENALKYYISNESDTKIYSVMDMIIGDGNVTESFIVNKDGTITDTLCENIPGSLAAIIGGGAVSEDMSGAEPLRNASLTELIHSGPNNELYLDSDSKVGFYTTKWDEAGQEDRTLQIEAKAVRIGDGSMEGLTLSVMKNGEKIKIADINTSTAMYYNIPLSACEEVGDGKYLVLICGDSTENSCLALTNLKVKGYEITPYEHSVNDGGKLYIANAAAAGNVKPKSEFTIELTLSKPVDISAEELAEGLEITANGQKIPIRSIIKTNDKYQVKVLSPNAVGAFRYQLAFKYSDETAAVTMMNVNVANTDRIR